MSDDEYHADAYSPYSDFEDLLYDADPSPDLADELATYAVHSPVFDDVPGNELDEYFSDWDYYSDDYYDDDPTILNNKPQDENQRMPRSRQSAETGAQKRGKKRKLEDIQDAQDIDLGERKALKDCMRGTVWAKPIPERDNAFVPGQTEKIALLKDWQQVFGTSSIQDKAAPKRSHVLEDESWANEMSLADMGLRSEQGNLTKAVGAENSTESDNDQDQEIELDDETRAALMQQLEGMDAEQAAAFMQQVRSQFAPQLPSAASDIGPKSSHLEQSTLTEPSPASDADGQEMQSEDRGRGQPKNKNSQSTNAPPTPKASGSCSNAGGVKKRKASASPPPEQAQARSSLAPGSRTKRVASRVRQSSPEISEKRDEGTSYLSSPDTPSTVFPDRLIRPLPKRTLKSRLSQEAADTIEYPPELPSTSLPSYAHYGENGEHVNDSKVLVQNDELDSADEGPVAVRHATSYRSSPRSSRSSRHQRYGSLSKASISGPDGYEAFENTNNKKKRKIPTSGSLSLHQGALANDLAHLGIGSTDGSEDRYNSSALGVQGAGRGRYARKSNARHPLGPSINGSNIRAGTSKYDQNMPAVAKDDAKDQGIISAAIANATALLRKPLGKGQDDIGVLEQQAKQAPANSQFTFTCETNAKGVQFPEQSLYSPKYLQRGANLAPHTSADKTSATQGTQTTPNLPNTAAGQSPLPSAPGMSAQGKKPRRRRGDVYALAARQRKLQQEYDNIQHPPAPEDIWICEFCEYESIFGQPPHALIRQYEIKDRKERRRLAEKRRLLEKAKLKGRKGKKQTKNAAKAANNAAHNVINQQTYDQQPLDQPGDDDLDAYDDDPIPIPAPPPPPTKQPMPGSYDPVGKGGGTTADGGVR
ncbi:hypothetical protein DV736_g1527, partial [Chaetothyriales sp. CBS 134916]